MASPHASTSQRWARGARACLPVSSSPDIWESFEDAAPDHEAFQDLLYDRNLLTVLAKIKPGKADDDHASVQKASAVLTSADGSDEEQELDDILQLNGETTKKFRFHRVFGAGESNDDLFKYIGFYSDCVLQGEDCGILAYGGKGSGKSTTLFGTKNQLDGLLYLYMRRITDCMEVSELTGQLSLSLLTVDESDATRDMLAVGGPSFFNLHLSREKFMPNARESYQSVPLDVQQLTRVRLEDVTSAYHFIQNALSNPKAVMRGKPYTTILTLYYDGQDDLLQSHGRLTLVDYMNSDVIGNPGPLDKVRSSLSEVVGNLVNGEMVNYPQSSMTYLLRDVLCREARLTVLCTLDASPSRVESCAQAISFAANIPLTVDLGAPLQRILVKRNELDLFTLQKLHSQLDGELSFLKEEIENCTGSGASRERVECYLAEQEIAATTSVWSEESQKLKGELEELSRQQQDYQDRSKRYLEDGKQAKANTASGEAQRDELLNALDALQLECEPVEAEYLAIKKQHEEVMTRAETETTKVSQMRDRRQKLAETYPSVLEKPGQAQGRGASSRSPIQTRK